MEGDRSRSCRGCPRFVSARRSAAAASRPCGGRSRSRRASPWNVSARSRRSIHTWMRIVVVGATGNVGTSLLGALADETAVESVLGIARRAPKLQVPKVDWAEADIAQDDLVPLFRGADAVVHLAWAIQPSRDRNALWRVNVEGST